MPVIPKQADEFTCASCFHGPAPQPNRLRIWRTNDLH